MYFSHPDRFSYRGSSTKNHHVLRRMSMSAHPVHVKKDSHGKRVLSICVRIRSILNGRRRITFIQFPDFSLIDCKPVDKRWPLRPSPYFDTFYLIALLVKYQLDGAPFPKRN